MRIARSAVLLVVLLAGGTASHLLAQSPAVQRPDAPQQVTLTATETETFLLKARIVSTRSTNTGVTDSVRATLSDGRVTHDAQVQTVNIEKPVFQTPTGTEVGFRDTYLFNVAGYRLARLLGLTNVPVSVERRVNGTDAAVTWWIDDVMMDENARFKQGNTMGPDRERTSMQLLMLRVFDELIQNKDRNGGNLLWTKDWTMWMIDHTRAFRRSKQLLKPAALERCDRVLLDRLRGLTLASVTQAVGKTLVKQEVEGLLARRDLIVKHFDQAIAQRGEGAILYTFLPLPPG